MTKLQKGKPTMPDYSWITSEMFEKKLRDLVHECGTDWLLDLDGVYQIAAEALNNETIEALEEEREEENEGGSE